MIVSSGHIQAMIEGMRRVRHTPEREWLAPIVEKLESLQPGEKLILERMPVQAVILKTESK